jgi:hypothetical protein
MRRGEGGGREAEREGGREGGREEEGPVEKGGRLRAKKLWLG